MKKTLLIFLVILVPIINGCANIAANYPPRNTMLNITEMPDVWKNKTMIWDMPGHSRAFFFQWQDLNIALAKADAEAHRSSVAKEDAREIRSLVKRNLTMFQVALFYIYPDTMLLRQGDVEITFESGETIKDEGVIFWENEMASSKRHNSRKGSIRIHNRWRKPGQPLLIRILVPDKHLPFDPQQKRYLHLEEYLPHHKIKSIKFPVP